jgi:hypothetical protein
MLIRLMPLILVLLIIAYLLPRLAPRLRFDPRLRLLLSGVGLVMLRRFLVRTVLPNVGRFLSALRFFR